MRFVRYVAILGALVTQSCALPGTVSTTLTPTTAFEGPREIAFMGTRTDVERSLEDSLRALGFRIKRFASTTRVTAPTGTGQLEAYNQSASRYAIEVDADVLDRCFGGGFRFTSLRVDVVDTRQNEVVLSLKSKGYSEKCQPMSGTIFGDISRSIAAAWQTPPSNSTPP